VHLILAPGLLDVMVRYAQSQLPLECCGLLVGSEGAEALSGSVSRFIPISNRLASATEYEMEPAELIASLRSLRQSGEKFLAIFHSHPRGPAVPSTRDIDRAYYPEAAHVIASLVSAETPEVRGFRIVDGEAIEIELRVIV
jgi:[CysO sulfur-carrier protein]-S-L-cysteine hydrolase